MKKLSLYGLAAGWLQSIASCSSPISHPSLVILGERLSKEEEFNVAFSNTFPLILTL
jgi:hypothetical protein